MGDDGDRDNPAKTSNCRHLPGFLWFKPTGKKKAVGHNELAKYQTLNRNLGVAAHLAGLLGP